MSKTLCVIPARMGSSRFPNKPMAKILGMPMLGHVALRCKLSKVFDKVVVATCDQAIVDYCSIIGVESVMTSDKHERASDRVQEATIKVEMDSTLKFTSVTMVQGDEPMVTPTMLQAALDGLEVSGADCVNLCSLIDNVDEFNSANCVKVVRNISGDALYFSRSPLPSTIKAKISLPKAYKQVCIIPFTRDFLDRYSAIPPTYLETIESIDMNRVVESGGRIHCIEIRDKSFPVDVPEDIARVETFLRQDPLVSEYIR